MGRSLSRLRYTTGWPIARGGGEREKEREKERERERERNRRGKKREGGERARERGGREGENRVNIGATKSLKAAQGPKP